MGGQSLFSHPSPAADHDINTAHLFFGLHPERALRVALLEGVMEPTNKAIASLNFETGGTSDRTSHVSESNGFPATSGRFCIINANQIVSLEHISVAANNALLREGNRMNKLNSNMKDLQIDNSQEKAVPKPKGIASDFIYAVGGSQNEQSVMKDYGFQGGGDPTLGPACIVACGFDASENEMDNFLQMLGGLPLGFSYFSRPRTEIEIKDMVKSFKLSQNEFDPSHHHGLAKAVVHRVATKFVS